MKKIKTSSIKRTFMLERLWTTYRIIRRRFGLTVRPVLLGLIILIYQIFVRVTFLLDNIFFPGYQKREIDRPIFIIGNPRSGTTFLHRFMNKSGQVCSFELWQMIMPAILGRKLIQPFVRKLVHFNPGKHHAIEAHETGLDYVETDDVLLFFRFFDGLFLYCYFLCWDDKDHYEAMREATVSGSMMNRRDLAFYAKCLRRKLYDSGKQRFLGKPFTFSMRTEDVLRAFPDARFIYLIRDPVSVIPSGMNLLHGVLEKQFGVSKLDPAIRQKYFDRLLEGEVELYRSFHDAYTNGRIPEKNHIVVRYTDLMQRFEETMNRIFAFIGLEITDAYREKIILKAKEQRAYRSDHAYDLADFGLDADRLHEKLDFVYKTFDLS